MHLIFVYGTLKRGFSRNSALRNCRYLGVARTIPAYGMYAYGGFPALVDKTLADSSNIQATTAIFGELYEVDDLTMVELDKIECVDQNLFQRLDVSLDVVTLMTLPISKEAWKRLADKVAQAYFFKRDLSGAADCGSLWTQD